MAQPSIPLQSSPAPLGKLTFVDARSVWKHEAQLFTPWLRDHIDLLADVLGLEIEVEGIEVAVGEFTADVLGREPKTGRQVVIENQLESTDHDHLGKLLTYSAGLNAATVVWISPLFRDAHRQVIDWLNQHTDEGLDFFGVEIEMLQIDSSLPAPHFKIVAKPNPTKLTKYAAVVGPPTERVLKRKRFFEDLIERMRRLRPSLVGSRTSVGTQNWCWLASGKRGLPFNWTFTEDGQLKVDLWIGTRDKAANKNYFDALFARRTEIEDAMGNEQVTWRRRDDDKSSDFYVAHVGSIDDPDDDLGHLMDWAVKTMLKWTDLLKPMITQPPTG